MDLNLHLDTSFNQIQNAMLHNNYSYLDIPRYILTIQPRKFSQQPSQSRLLFLATKDAINPPLAKSNQVRAAQTKMFGCEIVFL